MTATADRETTRFRTWNRAHTQTAQAAWVRDTRDLAASILAQLPPDPDAMTHRAATNQKEPT